MAIFERLILDTCIVSQLAYKHPPPNLSTWAKHFPDNCWAIAVATATEIERGIEQLRSAKSPKATKLARWLDSLIESDILWLEHDVEVARLFGRMSSTPALKQLWIPDASARKPKLGQDLQIAATSIRYKLPLATANVKDFMLIHKWYQLPGIYDPTSDVWLVRPSSKKLAQE